MIGVKSPISPLANLREFVGSGIRIATDMSTQWVAVFTILAIQAETVSWHVRVRGEGVKVSCVYLEEQHVSNEKFLKCATDFTNNGKGTLR